MELSERLIAKIKEIQRNEITEYFVYRNIAEKIKDNNTAALIRKIGNEELGHSNFWKKYLQTEAKPKRFKIFFYTLISRLLGLTFSIKLMEKGEQKAEQFYNEIVAEIPDAKRIIEDEQNHENLLINLIEEEKLQYAGAIVLGLNDALVELTGALAGLTFALQNTKIIALAGLITGIAASFSMSASSYLSAKADGETKNSVKSAIYTGFAYIVTVFLLVLPYLLFPNPFVAMALTIGVALIIIFAFNFYISVAKDYSFKARFLEMAVINLSVTGITFLIGFAVRKIFGIEV
jgi:VIT1/CCC1 family predicted Fe2+/Mn2+ transporter